MLQHAQHLDRTYNAGPHTISIPRIRPADQAPDALAPPNPVDDENFAKLTGKELIVTTCDQKEFIAFIPRSI